MRCAPMAALGTAAEVGQLGVVWGASVATPPMGAATTLASCPGGSVATAEPEAGKPGTLACTVGATCAGCCVATPKGEAGTCGCVAKGGMAAGTLAAGTSAAANGGGTCKAVVGKAVMDWGATAQSGGTNGLGVVPSVRHRCHHLCSAAASVVGDLSSTVNEVCAVATIGVEVGVVGVATVGAGASATVGAAGCVVNGVGVVAGVP